MKQLELPGVEPPKEEESAPTPIRVVQGGNGKVEEAPALNEDPKPADLPSIKEHVAKKRRRAAATAP